MAGTQEMIVNITISIIIHVINPQTNEVYKHVFFKTLNQFLLPAPKTICTHLTIELLSVEFCL